MKEGNQRIAIAIILALGFVAGLVWASSNFKESRRQAKEITVTGNAEKNISSDVVVWNAYFGLKGQKNLQEAYKKLAEQTKIVRDFFRSKGIADSTVTFESITLDDERDSKRVDGEWVSFSTGFSLTQSVRIFSSDIDLVEKLSREVSELIDKGLYINSSSPQYYYSKLEESKHELLEMASRDALSRAKAIATGSNQSVGKLLRSQMGVFQIVGYYENEDYSWGGNFNTTSREKTISVTVKSTYAVH